MRGSLVALLVLAAPLAAAQGQAPQGQTTMLKCRDTRGQITYSNVPCEKQGLQEVGPVADRTTVVPLGPPPKPPAASKDAAKDAKKDDPAATAGGAQVKPPAPQLEKPSK